MQKDQWLPFWLSSVMRQNRDGALSPNPGAVLAATQALV